MRLTESVRNLFERSDLLRSIYDLAGSFTPYQRLVASQIAKRIAEVEDSLGYNLMIELSSVCNARCTFCPSSTLERKKQIMTDQVFEAVLSRLQSDGIKPPVIDLSTVGEPLLDRSLFARIQRLKVVFPESRIRFTSNLAAVTENHIAQILSCGLDSIHISLNASTPGTYAKIMGLKFETTMRNVERLLQQRKATGSSLNVLVSMVLCPENTGEEGEFVRMWKGKVDSVRLQRVVDWGGEVDIRSSYLPGTPLFPCIELFKRIVILSNGDVALCCQDAEGIIQQNACDQSPLNIFHSSKFQQYRGQHLRGEIAQLRMCRNCFAVHSNGANWMFRNFD
jgi:Radical SAM superfamily/Iron-sulfur cluster-binding domain